MTATAKIEPFETDSAGSVSTIPEIVIDGHPYKAEFTWASFAKIRTKHGEEPDLLNPDILAEYTVAALNRHHPMVTIDQIMKASPAMVPVARAIRTAINRLFWGDEQPS
jgi:hypothetical protein